MDFLDFLRENANTWTSNGVVFNGNEFQLLNDVFPRFEVTGGRVREYLGDYTPYTLSSVNSWGGDGEYSVWKNGTTTGYNIKINGGKVELYSAGTRYYDDFNQGGSSETARTSSKESSDSYGCSSDEESNATILGLLGLLFPPLEVCLMLSHIRNKDFKETIMVTSAGMSGIGVLWSVAFFFAWYYGGGDGSFDHNYFCSISLLYMLSYAVYWILFAITEVGEKYDRIPLKWRVIISILFWVLFVAGYAIVIMYVNGFFG